MSESAPACRGSELRSAFHRELQVLTRVTARTGGPLIVGTLLAFTGFDFVLEPASAPAFLAVRVVVATLIAAAWFTLVRGSVPASWNEPLTFCMFAAVQLTVAWIIPQVQSSLESYLLGFSLALFGSAFIIAWHWRWTVLLVVLTWVGFAAAVVLSPTPVTVRSLTVTAFYILTASMIAVVGQAFRYRFAWSEFRIRMALFEEQDRNEALVARLDRLTREDDLTRLLNRRGFHDAFADAFDECRAAGAPVSVLLVDVDHFKQVNDRYGHAAGDSVLQAIASVIDRSLGPRDVAARVGGDEFAVVCPGADEADAAAVALAVLDGTRALGGIHRHSHHVTISVGMATGDDEGGDADDLLGDADLALYTAKRTRDSAWGGGRRWDPAPPMAHSQV